eukprot:266719-Chlamydomonas_euryale.AAC.12
MHAVPHLPPCPAQVCDAMHHGLCAPGSESGVEAGGWVWREAGRCGGGGLCAPGVGPGADAGGCGVRLGGAGPGAEAGGCGVRRGGVGMVCLRAGCRALSCHASSNSDTSTPAGEQVKGARAHRTATLTLIARRCVQRAGTRHWRRGADTSGAWCRRGRVKVGGGLGQIRRWSAAGCEHLGSGRPVVSVTTPPRPVSWGAGPSASSQGTGRVMWGVEEPGVESVQLGTADFVAAAGIADAAA